MTVLLGLSVRTLTLVMQQVLLQGQAQARLVFGELWVQWPVPRHSASSKSTVEIDDGREESLFMPFFFTNSFRSSFEDLVAMFRISMVFASVGLLSLAGCGGGGAAGGVDVYEVSGTVTMDGGPVVGASVTFSPKEGQPAAAGRTGNDGTFTLTTYTSGDGAAAGDYVVLVRKYAMAAPSDDSDVDAGHSADPDAETVDAGHGSKGKDGADETGNLLPANFGNKDTSTLLVTVEAGKDNNFPLVLE